MDYRQTVQYLYDSVPMFQRVGAAGYKPGLHNTLALDSHFCHPHRRFKTIHVAGTNGKGSCSHLLAAILQHEGYKVGLYTSPHLMDFRERIRVNGACIPEQYVVDFVERERPFFEPLHPSFFELTTALAFKYFADAGVDMAVIEVGLGGRLDCTNIITPVLSLITNIGLDHTQFLGNTLAAIASEKAGIIKHGVPAVIGETTDETRPVFTGKAAEMSAPVLFAEDEREVVEYSLHPDGITYNTRSFGEICGELPGIYQVKNTATVLAAAKILVSQGIVSGEESVRKGFSDVCSTTGLMGRWQVMRTSPAVICDTGHNVDAWRYLGRQVESQRCDTLRIVFGMVNDKDIETVMTLMPRKAVYYWTKASTMRALSETDVMSCGECHGLHGNAFPDVRSAYSHAVSEAGGGDFIFVGGSSYVVADFLCALERKV